MTFGIIGNTTKPVIKDILPDLFHWLAMRHIDFFVEEKLLQHLKVTKKIPTCPLERMGELSDIVLAFGGDGTILSTARAIGAHSTPILGVNLGGLGFLAEVTISQLYDSIEYILNNNFSILERMVLKAQIVNRENNLTFYGLNDIVIDKSSVSRVMSISIFINNEFLTTYLCDGVIIATPTGSTAYSLSAQGPILEPDIDAIIVNPICPHTLGARPMVIAADSIIKVIPDVGDKEATLCADGQVADYLKSHDHIIVKKADYKTKTVQTHGISFFNLLRTKLNWGIDKRT